MRRLIICECVSGLWRLAARASFRACLAIALISFVGVACSPARQPIPAGTVPSQSYVSAEEERYGQQVLSQLSREYRISNDGALIDRVRDIADKLAAGAGASQNPWNVYVFDDKEVKNAAATRGNFIFVWTGLLSAVQNDDELACIIAHEMGHVLANHPKLTPQEEANKIISSTLGDVTEQILSAYDSSWGLIASLGGALAKSVFEAALVNPEQRRQELEADQIGLFLMADSGFNPQHAVDFWDRVKNDPTFGGGGLQFLSTHPSSSERLKQMSDFLPQATERYRDFEHRNRQPPVAATTSTSQSEPRSTKSSPHSSREFQVSVPVATVWSRPSDRSEALLDIPKGTLLRSRSINNEWVEISKPTHGFISIRELTKID